MTKYVIDTYAWIEYFLGTNMGQVAANIIDDSDSTLYVSTLTIAELSRFFERNSLSFLDFRNKVESLSMVIPFTVDFADELGRVSYQVSRKRKHMGMADVSVYLVARQQKAKIVTGDQDFKGLPNVIMLK